MSAIRRPADLQRKLAAERPQYQWRVKKITASFGGAFRVRAEVMGHFYNAQIAITSLSHPQVRVLDYLIKSADDTLGHVSEPKKGAQGHGQRVGDLWHVTVAPPWDSATRRCIRFTAGIN